MRRGSEPEGGGGGSCRAGKGGGERLCLGCSLFNQEGPPFSSFLKKGIIITWNFSLMVSVSSLLFCESPPDIFLNHCNRSLSADSDLFFGPQLLIRHPSSHLPHVMIIGAHNFVNLLGVFS